MRVFFNFLVRYSLTSCSILHNFIFLQFLTQLPENTDAKQIAQSLQHFEPQSSDNNDGKLKILYCTTEKT